MLGGLGPQVPHPGISSLCIDPHGLHGQRLEEGSEPGAGVLPSTHTHPLSPKQTLAVDPDQSSSQGGIDEVMPGGVGQSAQRREGRDPRRKRIQQEQSLKLLPVPIGRLANWLIGSSSRSGVENRGV